MSGISDYTTIAVMCGLIFFIVFFRNKLEVVLRLFLRGVFGVVMIFCMNKVLLFCGIEALVGINLITFLTSAMLGIPGVCALYFIVFI